jgi:hypothetical protein
MLTVLCDLQVNIVVGYTLCECCSLCLFKRCMSRHSCRHAVDATLCLQVRMVACNDYILLKCSVLSWSLHVSRIYAALLSP